MSTVGDLLSQSIQTHAIYALDAPNVTLSKKSWTDDYPSIAEPNFHGPSFDSVNQFLAKDQYIPPNPTYNKLYTSDPTDRDRLGRQVAPLNALDYIHILQEGDVVRDFLQNIAFRVSLAWQRHGHFIERSESGPPGPTTVAKTVDHLYSWMPEGFAEDERSQVIGELKKPGVIKLDEWNGTKQKTDITRRLGREIRGYAYLYKCPQVFIYDGVHLLIIQFKARDTNEIKERGCSIDCCILPRSSPDPNTCTPGYGLYRLRWRGWMRMAAGDPVSLRGWDRRFRYWSGTPYWNNQTTNDKTVDHPDGYKRRFDTAANAWYWERSDGTRERYGDGNVVWDTLSVW